MDPPPSYIDHRIQIFDKLKAEYDEWVKRNYTLYKNSLLYYLTLFWVPEQARQEISITLPDGSMRSGTSWETTPMDVAKELSKSLSERIVIAKVRAKKINNELVSDGFLIGRWRIVGPRASFGKISKT